MLCSYSYRVYAIYGIVGIIEFDKMDCFVLSIATQLPDIPYMGKFWWGKNWQIWAIRQNFPLQYTKNVFSISIDCS